MADRFGNVWIGRQRELATMAHAADKTIVTVEKIHDGNLLDDPMLAAGTCRAFTSKASQWPSAAHGRWGCRIFMPPTLTILPSTRAWRRRRRASRNISTSMCMRKGGVIEVPQLS